MEQKLTWIVYNLICVVLALMMVKGTNDNSYKIIGLVFTISFILKVVAYSGLESLSGFSIIAMAVGFVCFIPKIMKSKEIGRLDKVFLILLPTVTVLKIFNDVLHLPHATEMELISIFIFVVAIIYSLIRIYITKSFKTTREPFEANGLFAAILLPTLIY